MAFAVHPSVPVRSLKELVALARARPGEISYGTPGVGTTRHVVAELFALTVKAKLTHVPYPGLAPANTALAGGRISTVVTNLVEMMPFAAAGKVRPIAVSTAVRAEPPRVPRIHEAGYAEPEGTNWALLVAPAATPAAALARLEARSCGRCACPRFRENSRPRARFPHRARPSNSPPCCNPRTRAIRRLCARREFSRNEV